MMTNGIASTEWASTRAPMEPSSLQAAKTLYIDTDSTIVGITSAEMSSECSTRLPGTRHRTSPTAAAVPIAVATRVTRHATWKLRSVDSSQTGFSKYARYHCSEKAVGGNWR